MKQSYDIKPAPLCMYSEIGTRCTRLSCIKRWRSSKSCMFSIAAANTFFFSFLHQPVDLGMAVAVLACGGKGSGVFVLEGLCAGDTAAVPASKLNHSCKPNVVCTDHGGGAFVTVPRLQGFLFFVCNECFWMKTLEARYYILFLFDHRGCGFYLSPMLTPGWEPEGPAQKNSQGVPWILLDISTAFFIPAAVSYISYMLGLYRNFIRRIPLLSNIKVLHALDSQSHGFLARRDFGTWNSSNRDFGRSVWMALCAIGFQIHRANASHVLGLSRNCTLPCICATWD